MRPDEALKQIENEYLRATDLYSNLHSNHEAYAVIKEEVDELWDEIKKSKETHGNNQIRFELIQIGAMVVRYLENLC
jgi:hypothetical protein